MVGIRYLLVPFDTCQHLITLHFGPSISLLSLIGVGFCDAMLLSLFVPPLPLEYSVAIFGSFCGVFYGAR